MCLELKQYKLSSSTCLLIINKYFVIEKSFYLDTKKNTDNAWCLINSSLYNCSFYENLIQSLEEHNANEPKLNFEWVVISKNMREHMDFETFFIEIIDDQ